MTALQDESRKENWALFQVRSMIGNVTGIAACLGVNELSELRVELYKIEKKILAKQKARMLVKEYYEKHPKIKVWCNELLDNKDIPK